MQPLFSIIIPIYNAEKYLDRCLQSIIKQTFTDFEIILINDGSTDFSEGICDRYAEFDSRIKVVYQANGGVSKARNAGLNIAKGYYISFIDSDDWIEENMYETLSQLVAKNETDIVRFNAFRKGELFNKLPFEGKYSGQRLDEEVTLPFIGSDTFGGMFILGVLWLHIFKRETLEREKIRFDTQLRRCEDRLFTLNATLHSQSIYFSDAVLYHYEVNEGSLSNKYDPLRWTQELIYLNQLKEIYTSCKPKDFIGKADVRLKGEYLLRAVTSINNEFFSDNANNFYKKYLNTKTIINNINVKGVAKNTKLRNMGLKGRITVGCIKYRLSLLLSLFNTAILYKNRFNTHG